MVFVSGEILTAAELNAFSTTTIVTTGNVGIGIAAPDAPLHIATADTADTELLRLTGAWSVADRYAYIVGETSTDGGILAAIGLGTAGRGSNNNDGGISFLTTNGATTSISGLVEAMAIDHTGAVGIGGFTTNRQFTVNATQTAVSFWNQTEVGAGSATGGVVQIGADGNATNPDTGDYWLLFRRGNGVTIGSVRGTGSASVNFSTTSDATLKTDNGLVTEERIGSIMDTLQVHDFDWNEGTVANQIGLFAQEAIDVLPESIVNAASVEPATADEDEMYVAAALDYSKIVPILIAECQFLRQRLDALESPA